MKRLLYSITFILILVSCQKDYIIQDSLSEEYQRAIDTLDNYDNYFIGEVNGELLVSVKPHSKGHFAGNTLKDSVHKQYFYSYKITNSEILKTISISFHKFETKNKLKENLEYIKFNDFFDLFNRDEFDYFQIDQYYSLKPSVSIYYVDYSQIIDNSGESFNSYNNEGIHFKNNNFTVQSVKKIENPVIGIEIIYTLNCTLIADSGKQINITNGNGKCIIEYRI